MFEMIAGIIYEGLKAYNGVNKKEVFKQYTAFMKEYYEELDKPSWEEREKFPDYKPKDFRDNGVIDRAKRGVLLLGQTYPLIKDGGPDLRSQLGL